MKRTTSIGLMALLGLAGAASGQISMNEIARVNLDAYFNNDSGNGTNPSAVAWDGTNLFVAGFNGGTAGGNTQAGIVRIDNALGAATLGATFGQLVTPGARGYSGLDISGGMLAAAYDDGAADPAGLQVFDMGGNTVWAKNIRGGSGVAFDPGYGGNGSGVAWTTFGQGRRFLQDSATGSDIFGGSAPENGMIITPDFQGSFWRDMDFGATGNMVARRSNDVTFFTRTGPNAGTASFLVENNENGPFVNGQNVAYVDGSAYDDFVLYNDRSTTSLGQAAANVLKAVAINPGDGLNPTFLSLTLNLIGGGTLADGSGYYDFSWDAASGTLALLDFNSRTVHIFNVPAPGALGLLGLGGIAAIRRRR